MDACKRATLGGGGGVVFNHTWDHNDRLSARFVLSISHHYLVSIMVGDDYQSQSMSNSANAWLK